MESTMSRHFFIVEMLLMAQLSYGTELQEDAEVVLVRGEYCSSDTFKPRCLASEVILIRNAKYGRMAIGQCINAEQAKQLGHIGCSTDVVHILEEKCSGKTECDVIVAQIGHQLKVNPCLEGLSYYLEASYECITVAGESRSCSVVVSANPVYLTSPRFCGTNEMPWTIQAPFGQKISVDLMKYRQSTRSPQILQSRCRELGTIVDGAAKRNTTICANEEETQTMTMYKSTGNTLQIFLDSSSKQEKPIGNESTFLVKLHAVGCIDIIPPEDAYLNRTDDVLVIGCYNRRATWQLNCRDRRWTGVLGNCSQHLSIVDSYETPEDKLCSSLIVALGGFTLTICLAIVCIGALSVKLLRSSARKKLNREPGVRLTSQATQTMDLRIPCGTDAGLIGDDSSLWESKQRPTDSVFVEEGKCGCPQELAVGGGWIVF